MNGDDCPQDDSLDVPRDPAHAAALAALAEHLHRRRDAILAAWRAAVDADPRLTSGAALPRVQLHDHIPGMLIDFERHLCAADSPEVAAAEPAGAAAAHGLQRWQQGFDLEEVTRELGRLNECLVAEIDAFESAQAPGRPGLAPRAMAAARRLWAGRHGLAITGSASQYFRLRQIEAAGHVHELEGALAALQDMERQRAELWQQAAHDLRGNLGVVVNATAGLGSERATEAARALFLRLLDRNVRALHWLLDDVTCLARLQGGEEHRRVAPMDAAAVLRELCEGLAPHAQERGLALRLEGPDRLPVEGDAVKTRRIVQNLLLNAIKYTRHGGIVVTWGDSRVAPDDDRWLVQVRDTGPGLQPAARAPLAGALEQATEQSRDVAAGGTGDGTGAVTGVEPLAAAPAAPGAPGGGEGIGLSIVKRLCALLDATIEVESEEGAGTVFRVRLPRSYAA